VTVLPAQERFVAAPSGPSAETGSSAAAVPPPASAPHPAPAHSSLVRPVPLRRPSTGAPGRGEPLYAALVADWRAAGRMIPGERDREWVHLVAGPARRAAG